MPWLVNTSSKPTPHTIQTIKIKHYHKIQLELKVVRCRELKPELKVKHWISPTVIVHLVFV